MLEPERAQLTTKIGVDEGSKCMASAKGLEKVIGYSLLDGK
jgi:hypothetical protein